MDYLDPENLVALARAKMPFGKYAGRHLIDLPEGYLVWFEEHGFPEGTLGLQLRATYEVKINGLEYLLTPLKKS